MKRLQGKRAVITGGTSGIGLASARAFHAQGATVLATGKSEATLGAARAALPADVALVRSDATQIGDIDALARTVRERWDGCDILFLNAGTARVTPLESVDEALFDELVALNLKAVFFAIQRMRPLLRAGASIIVNTSVAGHWQLAGMSVYAATKAGLGGLVRTLAAELAPHHIRVNALCPGFIETPIFGKIGLPPEALNDLAVSIVGRTPAGRPGTPDEIAKAAVFLASDEASYVFGAELVVDGGMVMR